MQIKIFISKHKPLIIELDQNPMAAIYCDVLKRNLDKNDFVFRDPIKYTTSYFNQLCQEVKTKLGWEWIKEGYSIEQTTKMHKSIESALDKTESFKNIPGDQQNLIHEAHFCLHQLQYSNKDRTPSIQIEWFNDDHEPLPAGVDFVHTLEFGDLILQNPYVGHPPIQCWQQNDYKNIDRTCQFHDIIKPGIKINTANGGRKLNIDAYEFWWLYNCSDYVKKVGWKNILKYTGFPKIGEVIDKDNLRRIVLDSQPLNITKIELL